MRNAVQAKNIEGLSSKMLTGAGHPLAAQVCWLGHNKCLRPMLAPHLYFILKDLVRLSDKPVRIFEVGQAKGSDRFSFDQQRCCESAEDNQKNSKGKEGFQCL